MTNALCQITIYDVKVTYFCTKSKKYIGKQKKVDEKHYCIRFFVYICNVYTLLKAPKGLRWVTDIHFIKGVTNALVLTV